MFTVARLMTTARLMFTTDSLIITAARFLDGRRGIGTRGLDGPIGTASLMIIMAIRFPHGRRGIRPRGIGGPRQRGGLIRPHEIGVWRWRCVAGAATSRFFSRCACAFLPVRRAELLGSVSSKTFR